MFHVQSSLFKIETTILKPIARVKAPVATTTGIKRACAYVKTIQFNIINPMPINNGYHPLRPPERTSSASPPRMATPPSQGSISNPWAVLGLLLKDSKDGKGFNGIGWGCIIPQPTSVKKNINEINFMLLIPIIGKLYLILIPQYKQMLHTSWS